MKHCILKISVLHARLMGILTVAHLIHFYSLHGFALELNTVFPAYILFHLFLCLCLSLSLSVFLCLLFPQNLLTLVSYSLNLVVITVTADHSRYPKNTHKHWASCPCLSLLSVVLFIQFPLSIQGWILDIVCFFKVAMCVFAC